MSTSKFAVNQAYTSGTPFLAPRKDNIRVRADCSAFDDLSFYHRVATYPQTCILYRAAPRSTARARVGHLGRSQSIDLVRWVNVLGQPEEEHVMHRLKTVYLCLLEGVLLDLVVGGAFGSA